MPSAPRSPATVAGDLYALLLSARVPICASLMVELPLDYAMASLAYAVFVGELAETSADERLCYIVGPAGLVLSEDARVAAIRAEIAAEEADAGVSNDATRPAPSPKPRPLRRRSFVTGWK